MRFLITTALACALAACDTVSAVQPLVTAETERSSYTAGAQVEVTVSNRADEPVVLSLFCGSAIQRRVAERWIVVWVPDCSRIREASTTIRAGSEAVGTIVLPEADTFEIGSEYRFRFSPIQRAAVGSEPLRQDAVVTNSFTVGPER